MHIYIPSRVLREQYCTTQEQHRFVKMVKNLVTYSYMPKESIIILASLRIGAKSTEKYCVCLWLLEKGRK